MKTILLIHGPNLNLLGKREPKHYGTLTLNALIARVKKQAKLLGFKIKPYQSNHEGSLIDFLQKHSRESAGIIINAGALTHYSYALRDALLDAKLPAVEAHLSKVKSREKWRRISVVAPACQKIISGKKIRGYFEALNYLNNLLK